MNRSLASKLATRPPEFLGEVATWDHAERGLKAALDKAMKMRNRLL